MNVESPDRKPAADHRTGAPRSDGWTLQRQAEFLSALSIYGSVVTACEMVEMSATSAYLLRQSPRGLTFALGWGAAHLIARERLADELLARAIDGTETRIERFSDGTSLRRATSPQLSMGMLNRLDRARADASDREATVSRAIAADFDAYVTLVLSGGGEAEIRAFLAGHADPLDRIYPEVDTFRDSAKSHQLVEKSAIFSVTPIPPADAEPCSCPADRALQAV